MTSPLPPDLLLWNELVELARRFDNEQKFADHAVREVLLKRLLATYDEMIRAAFKEARQQRVEPGPSVRRSCNPPAKGVRPKKSFRRPKQ